MKPAERLRSILKQMERKAISHESSTTRLHEALECLERLESEIAEAISERDRWSQCSADQDEELDALNAKYQKLAVQTNYMCKLCGEDLSYEVDGKFGKMLYSRLTGIEIRGEYDGVLYWHCPKCNGRWNRFTGEVLKDGAVLR